MTPCTMTHHPPYRPIFTTTVLFISSAFFACTPPNTPSNFHPLNIWGVSLHSLPLPSAFVVSSPTPETPCFPVPNTLSLRRCCRTQVKLPDGRPPKNSPMTSINAQRLPAPSGPGDTPAERSEKRLDIE